MSENGHVPDASSMSYGAIDYFQRRADKLEALVVWLLHELESLDAAICDRRGDPISGSASSNRRASASCAVCRYAYIW